MVNRMRFAALGLVVVAAVLAFSAPANAQFGLPGGMDNLKAEASAYHRVDGDRVLLAIEIEIQSGWHLYHEELGFIDGNEPVGNKTEVEVSADGVSFGKVLFPEPHKFDQPGLGVWIWGHEDTLLLRAVGQIEAGADVSQVKVEIEGLTCEDLGSCVLYGQTIKSRSPGPDRLFEGFDAAVAAITAAQAAADEVADGPEPGDARGAGGSEHGATDSDVDYAAVTFPEFTTPDEETRGLGVWLAFAFLAGMILNVMPCVLPVISIKVLSFVQQAGEDKSRILALGSSFAAGVVVVFLGLATLAAVAGQSWGEQFQSPTFLVSMIAIVFAFSLSLFGVFELGVPTSVGGLAGGPPREGLADAFFKGMLATVLATPCSGPFLGSTLTWTLSQPTTVIYAVFLALGLGMAFPYIVLTANPKWLSILPKPGAWMDTFKQSMGFVLAATVVFLMFSLRQDLMFFTVAFLVFVALGCWWWGRFATFNQTKGKRFAHFATALLLVALGARVAFVDLRDMLTVDEQSAHAWVDFEPAEFERLLESGESVMVDFTANWCQTCKYNENFVYDSAPVLDAMSAKGVVRIRADISHDSPRTDMLERLMGQLGSRSIPFMAIFPGDAPLTPYTFRDVVTEAEVLSVVESLP